MDDAVSHPKVDSVRPGKSTGEAGKRDDRSNDEGTGVAAKQDLHRLDLDGSGPTEANARHGIVSLRQPNADLMAQLHEEQAHLQMLQTGTIARGAVRLRETYVRLPVALRLALRRILLSIVWARTPHPIRRRLSIWRAGQNRGVPDDQAGPQTRTTAPSTAAQKARTGVADAITSHLSAGGGRWTPVDFQPFAPLKQDPDRTIDQNGAYGFTNGGERYVYLPPRRPDVGPATPADARVIRFSIVVPVYNTDPDLLKRMVASVRAQWYADWELILVDDASPDERTRDALSALNDPRIRVERAARNGGISAATNIGLDLATGDYVVFLDHDDELTIDCLHELASCIAREDPDFVYSDEDKIDVDGRYAQPFFKPDWSPDTMMSTMFTCHVMCVRRSLLEVVGGLRSEFDGSQDYDFVLRLVEHTDRIAHIPKILYHWRIIPASVAADMNAKPYAIDASRRAREAALVRRGLPGEVEPVPQMPMYFRVNYDLRQTPMISIIIPTKNNAAVVERCVASIYERTRYPHFEIVVMDNASTQADAEAVFRKFEWQPKTRVHVHRKPFNYSEINNAGVEKAQGELLLFLNDDTEVLSDDWLERMGGYAQLAHVGAVGAKLLYPETHRIQHNGVLNLDIGPVHALHNLPAHDPGPFMRNLLEWNWTAVTGACLMIERRKFAEVGGFDESFPIAYNDVKLCFDLRDRGYYNVVCPSVELIHHESLSRGMDHHSSEKLARLERELARLYQTSPQHFMRDPFHNPNLSATGVHFELPAA